jgi:hypothetical protein
LDTIDDLVKGLLADDKGNAPPAADEASDGATDNGGSPQDGGSDDGKDNSPGDQDAGTDDADNSDKEPADKSDGADDGDGEDQHDADDAGDTPEPSYTVKVDGKDVTVKLSEALAGYQRTADYTRKTQEVALQRQQIEQELATTREKRGRYEAVLTELQRRLGPAEGERTEAEWNDLRASDPAKYAQEYTDFQRRTAQREAIKKEQDRVAGEKQAEGLKVLKTYIDGERVKLHAALPEMADPEKAPKLMESIRKFGRDTLGFSDAELDRVYDSRMMILANMARQWFDHQTSLKAAKSKLAKAPTLPEPGAKQIVTPKAKREAARKAAEKRLEKTGRIEDALDLILK